MYALYSARGKIQGILYMENNLAAGVFDQQRKEILMPIAAQLAISLENAYLYENLRFLVDERTEELQEEIRVRQKAQAEVMHLYNNVPGAVFRCRYDRHFLLSAQTKVCMSIWDIRWRSLRRWETRWPVCSIRKILRA